MLNVVSITNIVQLVSAVIIGTVIFHYYRLYQREYLRDWSYSFAALAVYLVMAIALAYFARTGLKYTEPGMFILSIFKLNAGYLQITWLLLGTYLLFRPASPMAQKRRLLITMVVLLALSLACLYAFDPDGGFQRNAIRSGSRYLLGGLAFLGAAYALYRYAKNRSLGKLLVSSAFAVYGSELTLMGVLNIRMLLGYDWQLLTQLVRYHGIFELLIYPVIGLGLVIWLLENERRKRQQIYEKLAAVSHSDPLTGLANREGFEAQLHNWQKSHPANQARILVVLLGVDQFKRINEAEGVRQGDEVLVAIADRMKEELVAVANKARISGDVFACLLTDELANVENLEWLRRRFSRPLIINQQKLHIDISLGAAWLTDEETYHQVLINAQRALQKAKAEGGKKSLLFDASMPEQQGSLQLENELRTALKHQQFELFLQPIYETKSESISGFEVLTRWRHPERGILAPVEFIPQLAQLQLMPQLDIWTLSKSVELLLAWKRQGIKDLSLAVNLSPEGLQDDDYLEQAPFIVKQLGKNSRQLHIEITENSAMKSINTGKHSLDQLHDLGVTISIDDFGTGYSSLNYLKSFPADKIKFDRSFINEMIDNEASLTILRSLVPLCQQLRKTVVAEGIESDAQLQMAKAIGFDQLQGYYFAKPMPVNEASQLIEKPKKVFPLKQRDSH